MPSALQFRRRWTALPALFFGLPGAIALPFALWFWFALTPLQKYYLPAYITTAMAGATSRSVPISWIFKISPKHRPQHAQEADVIPGIVPAHPELPVKLSPAAQAAGWTGLIPVEIPGRPEFDGTMLQDEFFPW